MNMNLSGFNPGDHGTNNLMEPAWVTAIIKKSEEKDTQAGTGSYLALSLEIVDGPNKGRLLFENLNLDNPSKVAEQIAFRTLADICRATGVPNPDDSSELHDIPFMCQVTIQIRKDTKEEVNAVRSYMSMEAYEKKKAKGKGGKGKAKGPGKRKRLGKPAGGNDNADNADTPDANTDIPANPFMKPEEEAATE